MNTRSKYILIAGSTMLPILLFFFGVQSNEKTDDSAITLTVDDWVNELRLSSEVYRSYVDCPLLREAISDKKKPVLIYRYAQGMCNSCIRKDLDELDNFQSQVGKDKVLILPLCFVDDRNNKIAVKEELSRFNIDFYREELMIPLDSYNLARRYFAYIDKRGHICMIFFPINEKPELTQIYLLEMAKIMNQ